MFTADVYQQHREGQKRSEAVLGLIPRVGIIAHISGKKSDKTIEQHHHLHRLVSAFVGWLFPNYSVFVTAQALNGARGALYTASAPTCYVAQFPVSLFDAADLIIQQSDFVIVFDIGNSRVVKESIKKLEEPATGKPFCVVSITEEMRAQMVCG